MFKIVMALSAVFDYIAGAVGELAVIIFDNIAEALIDTCTLKDSFSATYGNLLFGTGDKSKGNYTYGLFSANVSEHAIDARTTSSIFGSTDPTQIFIAAGLALVFVFMIWQLFKALFGPLLQADQPVMIIWKGLLYTFLIASYGIWTNAFLSLVFSPMYKTISDISVDVGGPFNTIKNSVLNNAEGGVVSMMLQSQPIVFVSKALFKSIIMLIIVFPIGIKFIQLSLEIIERFLQIFFLILFGPLCLACGVSLSLSGVASKWFSSWINGMIALVINVLSVKLSILAFQNFVRNFETTSTGFSALFVDYIAVYAIFKIACEMDNIMNKVGLDTLRAGGLGAELMGGLRQGAHAASSLTGIGGRESNMFAQNGAMAAARDGGSKAAAAAMFFGNKGAIGKAIAGGIAVGTKDGQAALGAAMMARGFGHGSNSAEKFGQEMAYRSDMGHRGAVDGKDLGKIQEALNNAGIQGEVTKASFDDKGNLNCQMKDENGNTFTAQLKHDADFSNSRLGDNQAAMNVDIGGQSFGAIVPASIVNDNEKRDAEAGSTSATTAEAVASSVTSEGEMKANTVSENDSSQPLSGNTAYAAYNASSGQDGYEQLAVDNKGNLISCNEKGETVANGDHVLSASGVAIPKSSLETRGGQVTTFSNVGNNLMYNKTDGSIGYMPQSDAHSGNRPADFQSFSKDANGYIRTASAAAVISTGQAPVAHTVPTAGTNIAPTKVVSANGGSIAIAKDGYAYNVSMGHSNQVVSAGNQIITAAPSPTTAGMAQTSTDKNGDCLVQAQRFSDKACTQPSAMGSFVQVSGVGMRISDCAEVNNNGQFIASSSSSAVSRSVQLYSDSIGTQPLTSMPTAGAAVYAKSTDGSFKQIDNSCIESRVIPATSGANAGKVICTSSSGTTVSITPAPQAVRSDGSVKTYSQDSAGNYVENVAGTHIQGNDGNFYEAASSSITPVASGTTTKYMVGKIETDRSGNVELSSEQGSEKSSFSGAADVKTVYGQTLTAFSDRVELENVQTSGPCCNTIHASNADGQGYKLRLTDDNSSTYWQNADVNKRILSTALRTSNITDSNGESIIPNISTIEITNGEGHISCVNEKEIFKNGSPTTVKEKYHFLDKSMYELKKGTVPEEKTETVNMNGTDYYIVPEKGLKNFQKLESIFLRDLNNTKNI